VCLVDGWRSRHSQPFTIEDLAAAGVSVAAAFTTKGWTAWGSLLRSRTSGSADALRIEDLGRAFEVVRRFGPQRGQM
jgi:hypothetical protein